MKNRWIEIITLLLMTATVIAGLLTTTDAALLPPELRPYLPLAIGGIIILKQLSYGVLDLLDDGKLNKSYKPPTTLLQVVALLMLPLFLLSSCTSASKEADPELYRAERAVSLAQGAVMTAEVANSFLLSDPKTTPAQRLAAESALKVLRDRQIAREQELEALLKRRATIEAINALPADVGPPPKSIILPPVTATE